MRDFSGLTLKRWLGDKKYETVAELPIIYNSTMAEGVEGVSWNTKDGKEKSEIEVGYTIDGSLLPDGELKM